MILNMIVIIMTTAIHPSTDSLMKYKTLNTSQFLCHYQLFLTNKRSRLITKSKSKSIMMLIGLMTIGRLMKIVQSGTLSLSLSKKKCFNVKTQAI